MALEYYFVPQFCSPWVLCSVGLSTAPLLLQTPHRLQLHWCLLLTRSVLWGPLGLTKFKVYCTFPLGKVLLYFPFKQPVNLLGQALLQWTQTFGQYGSTSQFLTITKGCLFTLILTPLFASKALAKSVCFLY